MQASEEEKKKMKEAYDLFTQAAGKLSEAKILLYSAGDLIIANKLPVGLKKVVEHQTYVAELIDYLEKAKLNIIKLVGKL